MRICACEVVFHFMCVHTCGDTGDDEFVGAVARVEMFVGAVVSHGCE